LEEAWGDAGLKPTFFATPEEFRAWLEENHEAVGELWVGFHKKASGKPSITWSESVDQALCFGWIDGVRRSLDDTSYAIRFTPRRPRSTWSAVNVKKMEELKRSGQMRPAGLAAFEARSDDRTAIYAYEQRDEPKLPDEFERRFRADRAAWEFFQSQAPWYRRTATRWVTGAKKEETRDRRLATLVDDSREGRTIRQLTRPAARAG
jgi:uncharacterized protein YdeI (YjbR/CyaY-like superfamily)